MTVPSPLPGDLRTCSVHVRGNWVGVQGLCPRWSRSVRLPLTYLPRGVEVLWWPGFMWFMFILDDLVKVKKARNILVVSEGKSLWTTRGRWRCSLRPGFVCRKVLSLGEPLPSISNNWRLSSPSSRHRCPSSTRYLDHKITILYMFLVYGVSLLLKEVWYKLGHTFQLTIVALRGIYDTK